MSKEEIKKQLEQLGENNFQERLHLHGKLVALLKEECKKEKDQVKKAQLKIELHEELKVHKQIIEVYKNKDEYIPISKKLGLKIQEIATSISIFRNKFDFLGKIKRAGINSIASSAVVVAISLAMSALTGGISLATLASIVPSLSYVGLSNLLRSFQNKTTLEKLIEAYDSKEENQKKFKVFLQNYIFNNKELQELLKDAKEEKTTLEIIPVYEKIIKQFDQLIENAPSNDIKVVLQQEQTNFMKSLKSFYLREKEDYIQDKISLSFEEFTELEKKMMSLNVNIVGNEYFLKDAALDALKNTGASLAIMIVAKAIIGAAFPSVGLTSVNDLLTPTAIITLNNLLNIPKYKDKLPIASTKYDNKKINIDKEKLKELIKAEGNPSLKMA